tara:strand:+ start:223 stop:729 length:507 start_codon:yes stop_codon:yes gene_type:complete
MALVNIPPFEESGPLLSMFHSTRYSTNNIPLQVEHSLTESNTVYPRNDKTDVVMSNVNRTYFNEHNNRFLPVVENSRSKNLNTSTHDIGVTNRFIDRKLIQKNTYYIESDAQSNILDGSRMSSTPYTNQSYGTNYNSSSSVNTSGLKTFPAYRQRLDPEINSYQQRFN